MVRLSRWELLGATVWLDLSKVKDLLRHEAVYRIGIVQCNGTAKAV